MIILCASAVTHWAAHAVPQAGPPLAEVLESLESRRARIAQNPDDPQRAVLMADQAEALLFEYLPQDGLGLTALFGLPGEAEMTRAADAAREMFEMASAAQTAIGRPIMQVESSPGFANDPALQQQRRELVETQRERRIPFLRGIGAFLHAEWNAATVNDRRQLYELADQLLTAVIERLDGGAAREARLYSGLAKARLGDFEAAESFFAAVAKDPSATAAQVFTARMGGVINRTQRGGPNSGLESLASIESRYSQPGGASTDVFYRILIADHRFLLRHELAEAAPADQRTAAFNHALASWTDLLTSETRLSRQAMRGIVLSRLARATDNLADDLVATLPGLAIVARADELAQQPSTRTSAILMLERALGGSSLDADARAAGLFVLGRAMFDDGRHLLAAQRFIELAANHPTDSQAQRAIELGVTIASDLQRQSSNDAEAVTLYREGLNVLLQRYANLPTIDRWRLAAARLALEENRFDDADAVLAQITPGSESWIDGHFMMAAVARGRALSPTPESGANRQQQHDQTIATVDRVHPIIARAVPQQTDPNRLAVLNDYLGLLRIYRAEAQVQLHQPQLALQGVQGIENDSPSAVVLGEALKVRIDAYQMMRQPEDAMRELERFVQASPAQTAEVLMPMLASMTRDVQALLDAGNEAEAQALARRTLLPAAQLLEKHEASNPPRAPSQSGDGLATLIARAYLLSGEFNNALPRFDDLLGRSPDRADLLLGRAESLYGLGSESQLAAAMPIYKRLAAAGPDSPAGADVFWLSQLRMLQIVDRVNRHTEHILPRIERLRQQDPTFGGERYRRGFDALRMKHSQPRS